MKILLVSNFYYNRGGDTTHLFSLKKILEEKGHEIILFSMDHPKNFDSAYSSYFTSFIDYSEEVKNKSIKNAFKVLSKAIYSFESRKKIKMLIKDTKPDIAHLQNIHHHITPSIFGVLKKEGVPVVWTLHDYTIICPNTSFHSQGKICEVCKKRKFYRAPMKKCKKNSSTASLVAALETYAHRILRLKRHVDAFITPSEFLKNKMIEYGFKGDNIYCINNFIESKQYNNENQEEDYFLYAGRLAEEKGLITLIKAAIKSSPIKLKIIGDGPIREELENIVKENNCNNIEFCGHQSRETVMEYIQKSLFMVVPSEWYENYPYSILESFQNGKPVIGSRIGGIPEQVIHGKTGLLFESGNEEDLRKQIDYMIDNPEKRKEMGGNARAFVEENVNAEVHYQKTMDVYNKVLLR